MNIARAAVKSIKQRVTFADAGWYAELFLVLNPHQQNTLIEFYKYVYLTYNFHSVVGLGIVFIQLFLHIFIYSAMLVQHNELGQDAQNNNINLDTLTQQYLVQHNNLVPVLLRFSHWLLVQVHNRQDIRKWSLLPIANHQICMSRR